MQHPEEIVKDWIERVMNEGRNLTLWEQDFMESICDQFGRTHSLSARQEEILERIYVDKVP